MSRLESLQAALQALKGLDDLLSDAGESHTTLERREWIPQLQTQISLMLSHEQALVKRSFEIVAEIAESLRNDPPYESWRKMQDIEHKGE
jgi:hypothetical protein